MSSHPARLRAYVAALPPGSPLTSSRIAKVLNISQSAAHMALRRLVATGDLQRLPAVAVRYQTVRAHEHSRVGPDA